MADSSFMLESRGPFKTTQDEPPVRQQHRQSFYNKWFEEWWLWELLAVILSLALTIALCVILKRYDQQPVPNFGSVLNSGITLGAIVSLLTTISVAASLFAVEECVSQLKWIWYSRRSRQLSDLRAFDEASRGTLGSLKLLWKLRFRPFPSFGALLIIINLAIAPLAQQSILSTSTRVAIPSASATVSVASQYTDGIGQAQNVEIPQGYNKIGSSMKGAILGGLFTNSTVSNVVPTCTSGNCTIDGYQSLAVCWYKADVSSHIKESLIDNPDSKDVSEPKISQFCLPGGHCANLTEPLNTYVTSAADLGPDPLYLATGLNYTSVAFTDHVSPIADAYIFYLNATNPSGSEGSTTLSAVEILLDWCVPTFDTTVENGVATTLRQLDPFVAFDAKPGFDLSGSTNGSTYLIDSLTHYSLQYYLVYILSGEVYQAMDSSYYTTSDVAEALGQPFTLNSGSSTALGPDSTLSDTLEALDRILNNTATSMTNLIRTRSTDQPVSGITFAEQTITIIAWGYLAAPIVFTIASLVFFLAVAIFNVGHHHRVRPPTWKSNIDAVMRSLDPPLQQAFNGATRVETMKHDAEMSYLQLVPSEGGWRLITRGDHNAHAKYAVVASTIEG